MLLVTGATGTTGMEILRALKDRDVEARALVRDETKAHHLRDLGFEPATGDLGDPRTLTPALGGRREGVPRVADRPDAVRVRAGVPGDRQGSRRQAHREAVRDRREPRGAAALRPHARQGRGGAEGVRHGLDAAAPHGLHAEHARLGPARARRTFYSPVPDASFSIVDARDVAEVAAVALTEEGHEGKAYGLSGPEAVSFRDQAKRVFAAAGREVPSRRSSSRRSSASSSAPASRRGTPRA